MELVERTLNALVVLSHFPNGISVAEASRELDLPMSSTYRVLSSLKEAHFAVQNPDSKRYSLSYRLFSLCDQVRRSDTLISTVRPAMKDLSKKIQKNIILCVPDGKMTLNLDYVEYQNASMYKIRKGYESVWYTTSAGRVFAAFAEEEERKKLFQGLKIKAETPSTITDVAALRKELGKIQEQGYSLIDEELQENVQGVAAPVFDASHHAIAAIAFTTQKRSSPVTKKDIQELLASTAAVSAQLA
jgi:DNA-binding IclR family transcriptional regulator